MNQWVLGIYWVNENHVYMRSELCAFDLNLIKLQKLIEFCIELIKTQIKHGLSHNVERTE